VLIVGLGNPGDKYSKTRHNLGFMVADELCSEFSATFSDGFKGEYAQFFLDGEKHYVLKPKTYMNLSGESVQPLAAYFKIPVEDIIVVHDDLDIEYGRIKIKNGGNAGGHNGIKSIIQHLGEKSFLRLKMGIGKDNKKETVGHVLGKFSPEESEKLDEFIKIGVKAVVCCIKEGMRPAMNKFNNVSVMPKPVIEKPDSEPSGDDPKEDTKPVL
jgi:PTH1 family peptidyl-tRNA hydrolase